MLGYNLVDDGLGRFLIVVKFHGEEALAACHGPQIRRVAQYFAHGHMGLDLGNSGLGIRAQHLPAAR